MSLNDKGSSCVRCHAYIFPEDDIVYCPICGAPHHRECYNTLGHCALEELHGTEGLLVASKIADRSGITRSVIVNALRKLESAGVIESRSLGMKGTYIKIINNKFKEQLEKAQF